MGEYAKILVRKCCLKELDIEDILLLCYLEGIRFSFFEEILECYGEKVLDSEKIRECLKDRNVKYILILGANDILPPSYIEKIIQEMEKNPKLVIASGYIVGEPFSEEKPRGSGRIFKTWFLRKFGKEFKKKTRVISGGVDVEYVMEEVDVSEIEKKYNLYGKRVVLFVGRLTPQKGIEYLIKAADKILGDIYIIGDGPERSRLEKMAKELDLTENVRFLGRIKNHDDVIAFMKASKVFVLPSTREGFPNTILEANASGLPVVVVVHPKNAGAWVIRNGKNGLRTRLSEQDIAEKINTILLDEALLARMRSSALEFARAHDWDVIINKLEAVYRELL